MLSRIARLFAPLFLAFLATACASSEESEWDWEDGRALANYATLVVENDNTATVTIYAIRSGTRQRIGTITGLRTEQYEIRRSMLSGGGELRVAVSLLGSSRTYVSQSIFVNEGEVVQITISSLIR